MVSLVAFRASLQLGEHPLGSQCLFISQMAFTGKTVRKTCPGPHKGLARVYHTGTMRDPDTHRGHGKMDVYKDILLRDQPVEKGYFLLKLLNMLFQISGAEKMYLKDYGISLLKRKNMTEGVRTEAVLKSKCLDAQANLES